MGYYIVSDRFHTKKLFGIEELIGITATAFDFIILEPLAFAYKFWTWTPNGVWFGAPLANFIGWIFAISLFVFAYRFTSKKIKGWWRQVFSFSLLLAINLVILESVIYIWFEVLKINF